MSFFSFLSNRGKKEEPTLTRVQPKRIRNRKWNFDNSNPETLSLIKAGHSITLSDKYLIKGDDVKNTIVIIDLDNRDENWVYEGITRDNLDHSFKFIKNLKCHTK